MRFQQRLFLAVTGCSLSACSLVDFYMPLREEKNPDEASEITASSNVESVEPIKKPKVEARDWCDVAAGEYGWALAKSGKRSGFDSFQVTLPLAEACETGQPRVAEWRRCMEGMKKVQGFGNHEARRMSDVKTILSCDAPLDLLVSHAESRCRSVAAIMVALDANVESFSNGTATTWNEWITETCVPNEEQWSDGLGCIGELDERLSENCDDIQRAYTVGSQCRMKRWTAVGRSGDRGGAMISRKLKGCLARNHDEQAFLDPKQPKWGEASQIAATVQNGGSGSDEEARLERECTDAARIGAAYVRAIEERTRYESHGLASFVYAQCVGELADDVKWRTCMVGVAEETEESAEIVLEAGLRCGKVEDYSFGPMEGRCGVLRDNLLLRSGRRAATAMYSRCMQGVNFGREGEWEIYLSCMEGVDEEVLQMCEREASDSKAIEDCRRKSWMTVHRYGTALTDSGTRTCSKHFPLRSKN